MGGEETCPILSSAILMVFAAFFWIFYVFADKMQRFGQTTTDKFRVVRFDQSEDRRQSAGQSEAGSCVIVWLCSEDVKSLLACDTIPTFARHQDNSSSNGYTHDISGVLNIFNGPRIKYFVWLGQNITHCVMMKGLTCWTTSAQGTWHRDKISILCFSWIFF